MAQSFSLVQTLKTPDNLVGWQCSKAMEGHTLKLLWVAGKLPPKQKWQQQALFNSSIRRQIIDCGLDVEGLTIHSPTGDWLDALAHTSGSIGGLLLVRPISEVGPMRVLSSAEREQYDFFRLVDDGSKDESIILLDIVERCIFRRPVHIGPGCMLRNPRGRWDILTEWTHQRCMQNESTDEELTRATIDRWSVRWPIADTPTRLVSFLYSPHLILILSMWPTIAFQYAFGRRGRGLRCNLAKPLLAGYIDVAPAPPQGRDAPAFDFDIAMSPDLLLDVADTLRSLVQPGQLPQSLIDSASAHALWFQKVRDNLIRQQLGQAKACFQMAFLIDCVILSGLIRGSSSLRDIVETSLRIAIRDERLISHFREQLAAPRALPSRPTLERHRVTLHIGLALHQQQRNAEADAAGGQFHWATMDSSPVGHFEWLLHGFQSIKKHDLAHAFYLANRCWQGHVSADEESACLRELRSLCVLEQQAPGALGSGRCSLRHKMHVVSHSARMVSSTWAGAAKRISNVFSWTGDLGTESGVSNFYDDMRSLHGAWIVMSDVRAVGGAREEEEGEFGFAFEQVPELESEVLGSDGDGAEDFAFEPCRDHNSDPVPVEEAAPAPTPRDADYIIDCRRSIYIAGLLHMVHNCTKDIGAHLHYWEQYQERLIHVSRLLTRHHTKKRLLANCFSIDPQKQYSDEIRRFHCAVYTGRWGTAMAAIHLLLPLERVLRFAWNLNRYCSGGDLQEPEAGDVRGVKVQLADEAISSDMWWAYTVMLDGVSEALLEVANWAEGCPCHSKRPELRGRTRHLRVAAFQRALNTDTCPLRSMRAAELARVGVMPLLEPLFRSLNTALLLEPTIAALSAADKAIVVRDYAAIRRHIMFTFATKCAFWNQVPWVLAGLAHKDPAVARRCCRRALRCVDAIDPTTWADQHIVTQASHELQQVRQKKDKKQHTSLVKV